MKCIYYLRSPEEEREQVQGIKAYFGEHNLNWGDCSIVPPDYDYYEPDYVLGIRELVGNLHEGDVLFVWDYMVLGKTLSEIHSNLLLATKDGATVIQCLDGSAANIFNPEGLSIINAIGLASRLELKLRKTSRTRVSASSRYSAKMADLNTTAVRDVSVEPSRIVVRRYSERALVICGDSRLYKEDFKRIGALFNPRIDNGRPGWVISVKRLNQLKDILADANCYFYPDCC